jgi:hypothetical protein
MTPFGHAADLPACVRDRGRRLRVIGRVDGREPQAGMQARLAVAAEARQERVAGRSGQRRELVHLRLRRRGVAGERVRRGEPRQGARVVGRERGGGAEAFGRLPILRELELRIADELVPDRERGVLRAEPHRVADMLDALFGLSGARQRMTDMGVGAGIARIETDDALEQRKSLLDLSGPRSALGQDAELEECRRVVRMALDDLGEDLARLAEMLLGLGVEPLRADIGVERADADPCREVLRIAFERPAEMSFGAPVVIDAGLRVAGLHRGPSEIGVGVRGLVRRAALPFDRNDLDLQLPGDAGDDLVAHRVTIRIRTLHTPRPQRQSCRRIDQLQVDAQAAVLRADAALQHVFDLQLGPDRRDVDALVAAGGAARDHAE